MGAPLALAATLLLLLPVGAAFAAEDDAPGMSMEEARRVLGLGKGSPPVTSPFEPFRRARPAWPVLPPDPARPWLQTGSEYLQVDLSAQWPHEVPRNQGMFGTCTAFATVALYEAATSRAGRCIRLSEADAFLQADVLRWRCWDDARSCTTSLEGLNVNDMSAHLRSKGVLTGDDYAAFMGRYADAREREHADEARRPWFIRYLLDPFAYAPLFDNPPAEVRRRLESYAAITRRGDVDRQRRAVAADLARFTRRSQSFRTPSAPWELAPERCRQEAREQERFIDGELLEGRPVAVEMDLKGLEAWGADLAKSVSLHSFVISGVYVARSGDKYYKTRNSWGGWNPLVPPGQLCRVLYAESLLVPGERPAPADPLESLQSRRQ